MKKCVKCGYEISDTAKFCTQCQAKQEVAVTESVDAKQTICPACKTVCTTGSKFCNKCGHNLAAAQVAVANTDAHRESAGQDRNIDQQRGFITWSVLPGQLAVKIDEREMDQYGWIRGVYVAPGTKALFFVNGKYTATLESGRYSFGEMQKQAKESENQPEKKGALAFLRNIASHIVNGVATLFGMSGKPFYTIMLCRGNEFPLVYEFQNVRTKTVACNVGLHMLGKINNFDSFVENLLTDKKFISLEYVANSLQPYIQTIINQALINVTPEQLNENPSVGNELLANIAERTQKVYPYMDIVQMISANADNKDLEKIRQYKEELYIQEQELEQVQLRNDFLNRLQSVENNNALQNARSEVDFQALMGDIQLDGLRNRDRQEQVVTMLEAERAIRTARTETEMQLAFDKLQQSHMLSKEEINVLREQIEHRFAMVRVGHNQEIAMAELEGGQLLALATIKNQIALDNEKLKWEMEIGNKRFQNQLWRAREQRKLENEQREDDFDFEQRRVQAQMAALAQAQALRIERENAAHIRHLEEIRTNNEIEQIKYNHEIDKAKVMATMTFEQIMAMNPDISPEAAKALAEKFKAQAANGNNEQYNALVMQYIADMKAVGQQNLDLMRELIAAQTQAQTMAMQNKQAEIERVNQSAERAVDRVLDGVKTTVNAVAGRPCDVRPVVSVAPMTPPMIVCARCGKNNKKGSSFCEECGTPV